MSAVGENGVIEVALVEIPLDLLGWILLALAGGVGTVQDNRLGFGVGQYARMVPKLRNFIGRREGTVPGIIIKEEGVIRGLAAKVGLVDQMPSEGFENGLDKLVFELRFAERRGVGTRLLPKCCQRVERCLGVLAQFVPFGLEGEAFFQPMVGEQLAVADRTEWKCELCPRHVHPLLLIRIWFEGGLCN